MRRHVRQVRQPGITWLLIGLFFTLPPHTVLAADAHQQTKKVTINIGKLSQEIEQHKNKIQENEEHKENVLDTLEQIERNLLQQKEKINRLQQQMPGQTKLLAEKEKALQQAKIVRDKVLQHLQKRLQAFYLMGKTGILNVTFSDKDLPDLMLFTDSFKRLISYDQSIIDSYRDAVKKQQRAKQIQEQEKALLENLIRQAEEEKKTLQLLHNKQEAVLTRIRTRKALYKQALKEMHKAEADLKQTLAHIKQKEEIRKRGFQLSKGKLPPPVEGSLVCRFAERAQNGLKKGEKSQGITIATVNDAPVHAVYKGTVVFAGYKRGYGNMIIIDHGFKYVTVISRMDTILVKKGDKVKQGALLGTTGDMATLFDRGLYFEIRYKSKPQDPLRWLKSGTYAKMTSKGS
jgi:septal ring factor EnvC (AmiA/AmiB activator)